MVYCGGANLRYFSQRVNPKKAMKKARYLSRSPVIRNIPNGTSNDRGSGHTLFVHTQPKGVHPVNEYRETDQI